MKKVLLLLGLCIYSVILSQISLEEVDFKMIPQRRVRQYIEYQKQNNIDHFSELYPSCEKIKDLSEFSEHDKVYLVKRDIDDVWDAYIQASPVKTWDGRIVSFGIMYSRNNDKVVYRNNSYKGLEEGQIIYVNLKFFRGFYNLATAFEIVDIDDTEKIIQFSYIQGGKAQGIQTLRFVKTEDGFTKIYHHTDYKSDSHFRDRFIYVHFHKKCINQFHRNVKKLINVLTKG